MCGIFGKLYFHKKRNERQLLINCLDELKHRGPDGSKTYEDEDIFLSSRRLSVIDLSKKGLTPIANENGRFLMVFNGEIFNYIELKRSLSKKHLFRSKSDSEVVLHLFEEVGPACLNKLRGMFAFAIWDKKNKELFIARDHLGKKPLKYYIDSDCFVFSSELKAILKDGSIPKELDTRSIGQYLTYQYVPSPGTGFKNIYKLQPAHYMLVKKDGRVSRYNYWKPRFFPKLGLSEEELISSTIKRLREAVRIRLRSDVPIGIYLSGGLDSSLITALIARESGKKIRTFSIGFKEKEYNELHFARQVAERYGTDHEEYHLDSKSLDSLSEIVYAYEEPFADPSIIPTWVLCKKTKGQATVFLNGDGGDELFAGYLRYKALRLHRYMTFVPGKSLIGKIAGGIYGLSSMKAFDYGLKFFKYEEESVDDHDFYLRLMGYMNAADKKNICTDDFIKQTDCTYGNNSYKKIFNSSKADYLDKFLYTDLTTYLPEDLLVKTDIGGMSHSLEIRSPFLDQELVGWVNRIPSSYKLRFFQTKYLLKKIAGSYLPKNIIYRSKQGFGIPLKSWLKPKLRNINAELLDDRFLSFGIFDGEKIKKLFLSDNINYNNLWTLYVLKKWLDTWF
jgi:asparagine synthase (glutamine-hydrolysing)